MLLLLKCLIRKLSLFQPSLIFRCGLGYLHQENVISAHCASCHLLTLMTCLPSPLHSKFLLQPLFFIKSHALRQKYRKAVTKQQNKKKNGQRNCAQALLIIGFPLILHDLHYCHFKTGFCKTLDLSP